MAILSQAKGSSTAKALQRKLYSKAIATDNMAAEGDEIVRSVQKCPGLVNPLVVGSNPTGPTTYTFKAVQRGLFCACYKGILYLYRRPV